jgi:hypothetical protein
MAAIVMSDFVRAGVLADSAELQVRQRDHKQLGEDPAHIGCMGQTRIKVERERAQVEAANSSSKMGGEEKVCGYFAVTSSPTFLHVIACH